jgi:hypothetical protein
VTELLFGRRARLLIGKKGEETANQFDNLRIQFVIEKTSETTPNQGMVKIFNLKSDNREKFQEEGSEFGVILQTGYGEQLEVVLKGDVTNNGIKSEKQGPDIVTTINVGDGQKQITEKVTNTSFGAGTNIFTILNTLTSDLGFPLKKPLATTGLTPQISNTGEVLSGNTSDLLTQYLNLQGFEWNVQNEELVIKKPNEPSNFVEFVLITSESGLVGSPAKKSEELVEFTALHNPQIEPGRLIDLQSRDISGNFLCRKVTHRGDTDDGDFVSIVECERR